MRQMENVVTAFERYQELSAELQDATQMFQEAAGVSVACVLVRSCHSLTATVACYQDQEIREMAREEMRSLESQMNQMEDDLKLMLLPSDPNDERNVMLEIRAGTGSHISHRVRLATLTTHSVSHTHTHTNRWR